MGCSNLVITLLVMTGLYGVIYTPISSVLRFPKDVVAGLKEALVVAGKNTTGKEELIILNVFEKNADKVSSLLNTERLEQLKALKEDFNIFGIDLTQTPNAKEANILWLIPILACLTALASSLFMFFRQKKQNPEMAKNPTMGCMTFMSPVMSLVFTFMFPAGVGVYWIISNILAFVQQVFLTYLYSPKKVIAQQMVDETVVRRSKENNTKRRVDIEKK
jgi:YidC/Oxa1 family membrane protein insertase